MFTGIIEEMGKILRIERAGTSAKIQIQAKKVLEGTKVGDSIAVNGVCLTVTALGSRDFTADVMPETLSRSSLGQLKCGGSANLERAMAADGRFGGHIVSGHIDGTGAIEKITREGNAVRYLIAASPDILRGVVEKGSIAIDGISLTVTTVQTEHFEVSVIPHTLSQTTLAQKKQGAIVNLENDVIGKYVERLLLFDEGKVTGKCPAESGLTKEFLLRAGF
ncbi:MAG: riboflavin synthase [Eubacterium sp.]|nr:riboflavin synthase [Eubacterium sp.]